jgi:hypothetical protein
VSLYVLTLESVALLEEDESVGLGTIRRAKSCDKFIVEGRAENFKRSNIRDRVSIHRCGGDGREMEGQALTLIHFSILKFFILIFYLCFPDPFRATVGEASKAMASPQ